MSFVAVAPLVTLAHRSLGEPCTVEATEEPCTIEVIRGTLHHRGLMGNRGIEAGEGGRQTQTEQTEQTEQKEDDSGGKGMTTYKGKKE